MVLVEHHLKTATVCPSSDQQQAWIDRITVQDEGERPPAPRPLTTDDKLEDAVQKLHRKTMEIKRLVVKSIIRNGNADTVDEILTKIQTITDEADSLKQSLRNILILPSNFNFQR